MSVMSVTASGRPGFAGWLDADVSSVQWPQEGLPFGDLQEDEQGLIDIVHAGRIVLIDRWGQVRAYYDGSKSSLDALFEQSQHVLAEKHRPSPRAL